MSLLNDMLRDLSRRQPVVEGAEGYDDELLQTSTIAQKKSHSWLPLLGLFVVIFVLVFGINYAVHKFSDNRHVINPSIAQVSEKPGNENQGKSTHTKPAQSNMVESTSPNTAIPDTAIHSSAEASVNIELQNHINDLLLQAERALGMDRLTAPVEDNAYGYYQKILSMDTNNAEAKEGLDKIASRYLIKAQEQVQLGNAQNAEALLQRARFVSARYVDAHNVDISMTDTSAAAEISVAKEQMPNLAVQTVKETIKPFVVAEAPSVSVSPNAGWKDEQLARHAQVLIQQGKQVEAQALLKTFVASEQTPALSAALLAEIYIQQSNTQAAEIILEHAHYFSEDVKAKLNAQIASGNGNDAQAISLLEKSLNSADANEGYRSLLASLYHKTANYQQSIISYQRLMNSFGEKPAYWLGLALAYDGLAQHKSALQAYQRLREYPQLQEQVKQYTDQRIAALRSQ